MAIDSKVYKRPTSAMDKYSAAKIFLSPPRLNTSTITHIAPATPLPTSQNYTSVDIYAEDIICGGTIKLIGQRIGFLIADTTVNKTCDFVINGALVLIKSAAAQVFDHGNKVFVDYTDGLAYTATGATRVQVGFVEGDLAANATVTNPDNLPVGDYVYCRLDQIPS
jgi:predicted RecA/RadA family phage recombinase